MSHPIEQIYATLVERKTASPQASYVASLYEKGLNKILEKIGEEATETLLAAKDTQPGESKSLIHETADLWFHTLVMLAYFDIPPTDVFAELERRLGTSGLEEKAARHC